MVVIALPWDEAEILRPDKQNDRMSNRLFNCIL